MTASAPDPRLESLRGRLLPGAVRTVRVVGFDGADVLVRVVDAGEGASKTGRIPLHDVSMRRVEHPSELFTVGQEIEAEETGRWRGGQPHFSARACENPTLRAFLLGCAPGQEVTGTVAGVHGFGVFVHVDGEPEGMCTGFVRVPDLTWGWIEHPSQAVEAGRRITAEVITSETRSGQIALSLKALQEDPLIRFADQAGLVLTGTVVRVLPFGVLVRLAPDVVGLLHLSEPGGGPSATPGRLVAEGEPITVKVTEVDLERHRVRLCAVGRAAES